MTSSILALHILKSSDRSSASPIAVDVERQTLQCFIDAVFEDVIETRFPGPIGTWLRDKDDKLTGLYWTANMLDGLNGMSNITLRCGLGMSSEDMEQLLVDVRHDLKDRKIHSYWPM
jgi:hypothetical protein